MIKQNKIFSYLFALLIFSLWFVADRQTFIPEAKAVPACNFDASSGSKQSQCGPGEQAADTDCEPNGSNDTYIVCCQLDDYNSCTLDICPSHVASPNPFQCNCTHTGTCQVQCTGLDNVTKYNPGDTESASCGSGDCGGSKTRTCQSDGSWNNFSVCSSSGSACSLNLCTVGTTCSASDNPVCSGGGPKSCNDNNSCTADSCNMRGGCVNRNLPVSGGWSAWSAPDCGEWSSCSNGQKTQTCTQTRTCNNPTQTCGGSSCVGDSTQTTINTDTQTCGGCSPSGSTKNYTQTGNTCSCQQTCQSNGLWSTCALPAVANGGWSDWSCVDGISTRFCTNPVPSCGGSACTGPSTSGTCSNGGDSGGAYNWAITGWGSCSVTCGGGTQTATYACKNTSGQIVADSFCPSPKPISSQWCNTQACGGPTPSEVSCGDYVECPKPGPVAGAKTCCYYGCSNYSEDGCDVYRGINGVCGSASSPYRTFSAAPTNQAELCNFNAGWATAVRSGNDWLWTCFGQGFRATNAYCSAGYGVDYCSTSAAGENRMQGCLYKDANLTTILGNAPTEALATGNADNFTAIYEDWGYGGPSGLTDNFSIRWKGVFTFSGGTYQFNAGADDGLRLYTCDEAGNACTLVFDKWIDEAFTTYTTSVVLTAGRHTIKYEYYEHAMGARAYLGWAQIAPFACTHGTVNAPASVSVNTTFAATVDYGVQRCTSAPAGCTWTGSATYNTNPLYHNGWVGTAAEFACTAPAAPGTMALNFVPCDPGAASYCSQSAAVAVNSSPPPPPPGEGGGCNTATTSCSGGSNGTSGGSEKCDYVRLYWHDNTGGTAAYKIYKDGTYTGKTTAVGATSYDYYLPGDASVYTYTIKATKGGVDSDFYTLETGNPIAAIPCQASLAVEKDIVGLNHTLFDSSAPTGSLNGHTDALSTNVLSSLKTGDILSFSINLRNQGSLAAANISVVDNFINLKEPTLGFNAKYNGSALTYDGAKAVGYNPASGHYAVTGTAPNQTLVFNLTGAAYNIPAPVAPATETVRSLTFDAQLTVPNGYGGSSPRFQNCFKVSYEKTSGNIVTNGNTCTPLLFFSNGIGNPIIIEIP